MDATKFDRVIRALTASRRTALRGLAGGSLIAVMGHDDTEAKKKRKRKRRKKRCDCPAGSGKICQGGNCVCPEGQEDSGGVCGIPPTCGGGDGFICFAPTDCCSQVCTWTIPVFKFCAKSEDGAPCHSTDDCAEPGSVCRGFVCVDL